MHGYLEAMSHGDLFSEAKTLCARNQHKDVVRRAANFRVTSYSSFLVYLAGSPPPAFATSYAKYRALYDFASEKRYSYDIGTLLNAKSNRAILRMHTLLDITYL
jgi:hypothetical protein